MILNFLNDKVSNFASCLRKRTNKDNIVFIAQLHINRKKLIPIT